MMLTQKLKIGDMEIDVNDLILDEEQEAHVDKEYYIDALCDKFPCGDDMDLDKHLDALNKAIDKTIEYHKVNGKVIVEDWDMFDQDLTNNAYKELEKIYS